MSTIDIIGWLGAACFAVCGFPQAYMSWKQGHSRGVSGGFLSLWLGGEILTILYMLPKEDWPILFNLFSNVLFIAIIVYYKLRPRSKRE